MVVFMYDILLMVTRLKNLIQTTSSIYQRVYSEL